MENNISHFQVVYAYSTYFSVMSGSECGLPWISCFLRSLGLFLFISLDMALRLVGFGEFPGLDFGVPVGLGLILGLSPALKDFDLCLPRLTG